MSEIRIDIAGIRISLSVSEPELNSRIRRHYSEFLSEAGSPEAWVSVSIENGADYIPIGPGTWIIETDYHDGQLDYMSYREKGFMDFRSGKGHLILRPGASIENYLRVLYAWLCVKHEALLVHSAGILRNGHAYVFFGPSGSGKTTITRFSEGHTILSDDLVIIKKQGEQYHAYGVPFRGEAMEASRTNAHRQLKGLFLLKKGIEHRVAPLAPANALGQLVASIPFIVNEGGRAETVMDVAADLVQSVPPAELWFRRDADFWSVIDDHC